MKRKRTTLEQWAQAAGLPRSQAKQIIAFEYDDPAAGTGTFLTIEESLRRFAILNLALLRRLLDLAQGASIAEATAAMELVATFAKPYLDTSAAQYRLPSSATAHQFLRRFVAELKRFIEKPEAGIEWKIQIGGVSKTLSWDSIRTGGGTSLYRSADWRAAFLLRVTKLIDEYGSRIRQCARADCGRIFVSDDPRRQKFCSPKCGAIDRERRFREKQTDWAEYRRNRRKQREGIRKRQKEVQTKLKTEREPRR
jgi:CGNR zinc finger